MLKPHSDAWYDRLATLQSGYFYPWRSTVPPYNGEDTFLAMLDSLLAPDKDVLEVGCGHGAMALDYAPRCRSVLAVDRVPAFVELARQGARAQGIANVQFVCDEGYDEDAQRPRIPAADQSFDLLISRRGPLHWVEDAKRVARLMDRLEADGRLVNPPITTYWKGKYVILDGATRFTAFKELGYPHIIVQVASTNRDGVQLHTWYHAISSERPFAELQTELQKIDGLTLTPLAAADIPAAFQRPDALCYFLDPNGNALLATAPPHPNQLTIMNEMVQCYNQWGNVERTLLTNPSRLLAQFPNMAAVAIFPQFKPETVFDVASDGRFVPAGLTRFVIPGRILRLNADLQRLKADEPLAVKRAWFNDFLADKLARSRLRYYQEPVVLLDE